MAESKYGRLFTEEDVRRMMRWAFRVGRRSEGLGEPEPVGMIEAFEGVGGRVRSDEAGYSSTFPADEPLFLLRGQDAAAPDAVAAGYMIATREVGASTEFRQAVVEAAAAMFGWQARNPDRVKVPD